MRDGFAPSDWHFGGPDVHAPVDLPRVGADDLDATAGLPELNGQADRQSALPGRRRAADDDERRVAQASEPLRE